MITLSKPLARLTMSSWLALLLLGAASAASAQAPPDVVVRTESSGKFPGPVERVWIQNLWLDDSGILSRTELYELAKPAVVWTNTVTRTGNTLQIQVDEGEGQFSEGRLTYSGLTVDWKGARSNDRLTVAPEAGVLWKNSRIAAWGDAMNYEELPLQPDRAFGQAQTYWVRQGNTLSDWQNGNLNARYIYQTTPSGYSAVYQSQVDVGSPFETYGGFEVTGPPLHNADPIINVINAVLLEAIRSPKPELSPSLWGWDLTKETQ